MSTRASIDGRPVGAVVVTFFPDDQLDSRFAAIGREFAPVIVVDNSTDPVVQARVRAAGSTHGFEYIGNAANLGLAAALNRGFARHASRAVQWAVAFDQDSTPEPGFADALIAGAQRPPRPAVIGANWTDEAHADRPSRHLCRHPHLPLCFQRPAAERDLEDVTCVIASGSLFDLSTWTELAGFDEGLFLDLVDTDYCLRAARRGRTTRVAAAARLRHRRGSKQPVRFAGRTFFPAFMPPLRLRYLFRNRIALCARHARSTPHVLSFELVYAAKILTEIVLFEDRKLRKLAACARGVWDGLTGRKGPIASA
ncbi:MAG: glycosyltransferase [Opitutaceae bacterium]|nr:glycosyltransferase [Opitutaceae bacterium]